MAVAAIDITAHIETPEHIELEVRIAGPWRRGGAYLIDFICRAFLLFIIGLLGLTSTIAFSGLGDFVEAHFGLMLVGYFVIEWFYCMLFEWLWNGRTPGKLIVGLRVIKEGGFPIGLQDALLRNLLRAADSLPPLSLIPLPTYLVGAMVAAWDPRFRRLGDLVAGTIVIVEDSSRIKAPATVDPPAQPEEMAQIPAHFRLNVEEKRTIDAFMRRLKTIHPDRREEISHGYAAALARRIGAPPPRSGTRFLQLVYTRMTETAVPLRSRK